jgi:hypothetical protein
MVPGQDLRLKILSDSGVRLCFLNSCVFAFHLFSCRSGSAFFSDFMRLIHSCLLSIIPHPSDLQKPKAAQDNQQINDPEYPVWTLRVK